MLNQIEHTSAQAWTETDLRAAVQALERENAQLRQALTSRILIEQAKGMLAERYRLDLAESFELLRRAARTERRRIHDVAAEVLARPTSPLGIDALAERVSGAAGHVRTFPPRLRAIDGTSNASTTASDQ